MTDVPPNPYQTIEEQLQTAQTALDAGKLSDAQKAILRGFREIGKHYNRANDAGTLESEITDLRAYNGRLMHANGRVIGEGTSRVYERSTAAVGQGLETLLGKERLTNTKEGLKEYRDALAVLADDLEAEAKDVYADAKELVHGIRADLGGLLERAAKRVKPKEKTEPDEQP